MVALWPLLRGSRQPDITIKITFRERDDLYRLGSAGLKTTRSLCFPTDRLAGTAQVFLPFFLSLKERTYLSLS